MNDSFQTLGISRGCTAEEVRKAYRELARRWHPDRFMAGPEREWANQRMTEINAAYRECTEILRQEAASTCTDVNLDDVHRLIQSHHFSEARHALLRSKQRSARWNFLFGTVLQAQGEVAKALTYFNFAVRQAPDNGQYRSARDAVKHLILKSRISGMLNSIRSVKTR